jgi:hypothetical protein
MAAAKTARLIASLELEDKFSKGIKTAESNLGKFGSSIAKSRAVAVGLGIGLEKAVTASARAVAGFVGDGIASLAELESATTSVAGAISQVGLTGQVSAGQVADWANDIEANVNAAFDDKAITAAAATLIRYGKVTGDNLRPAMEVMTDLAAKTGDVDSAANLLAKALADPEKAAGKLARQGVILTKAEQEQIKAFMKAGKVADAQAVILESLEKTTRGAAAATAGPYQTALNRLADASEDAKRALAVGFLPVIEEVADFLSKELAKPETLNNIRDFGKGLAGGLREGVKWARQLPWGAIADGLRTAAGFAQTLIGAFTSMPPQAQAAIIALAGLNKLSGGAVAGIVGELGRGLVKGVLGMTAGVVNLKAATVVSGPGGGGALPGAAAGAGGRVAGIASAVAKVAVVGMAVGVAAMLGKELADQSAQIREQGKTVVENAKTAPLTKKDIEDAIRNIDEQVRDPLKSAALLITNPLNGGFDALKATRATLVARLEALNATGKSTDSRIGFLIAAANATTAAVNRNTGVLSAKDMSPQVGFRLNVNVSQTVSVRDQVIATQKRYSYVGGSTAGGTVVAS